MSFDRAPRAVCNHNPGNLRKGIVWQGLASVQSDPDFCVFESAAMGFRALAIDLHTKWKRDGLRTVAAIISKYAPPSENNTAAYIKAVSDMTGFAPDAPLDLDDFSALCQMCRAIAVHESGGWFFNPVDLVSGVPLAVHEFQTPALIA